MAASLSTLAGKDGLGAAIVGGVQALDLSGAGTGPWSMAHILVDGISGITRTTVKPASTPPSSADTAMVVAIHPLSLNANVGNNVDGVASAATTAAPTVSYNYGYNGTTWDRLQVDGSKNLKVALASTTITGSVAVTAAALPLPTGAALETGGNLAAIVTNTGAALPAGTAVVGKFGIDQTTFGTTNLVVAAQDTATIANSLGAATLTPQFAVVTASASGGTTIVPLTAGKRIRVVAWDLKCNAAVNFKWQSHVTGDISGLYPNAGLGDGMARAYCPVGYFQTVAGEALDLNLSGAVAVGGALTYVLV